MDCITALTFSKESTSSLWLANPVSVHINPIEVQKSVQLVSSPAPYQSSEAEKEQLMLHTYTVRFKVITLLNTSSFIKSRSMQIYLPLTHLKTS